jgi:glycosyltransferase involved in cell wall biosynthesis
MTQSPNHPKVAYLLRSFPRLSQTFILHEILALEQFGVPLQLFAMTNPHEPVVQAQVAEVQAPVAYLETAQAPPWVDQARDHLRLLIRHPWRYLQTLWYVWRHPECDEGYTTASRYRCFHYAVALALRLRCQSAAQAVTHLHAHFAHDPTLIAQLVHLLTGVPFSFTAHARDLYQIPPAALLARIEAARLVVTCCGANLDYLKSVAPARFWGKFHLIHHGVNLTLFQPAITPTCPSPPLILAVGRLVAKKGFADLIHACALLKEAGYPFRCLIYGDGPLEAELSAQIAHLGLTQAVTLAGASTQQELVAIMQQATLFALTPYVTDDGDRDGVPNVLVEAMACGLPVVSTTIGGVPELVTHEVNGLLAPPHDVDAIAANLALLLADELLCERLGRAAHATVTQFFNLHNAAQRLAMLFHTAGRPDAMDAPSHEPFTAPQPVIQ